MDQDQSKTRVTQYVACILCAIFFASGGLLWTLAAAKIWQCTPFVFLSAGVLPSLISFMVGVCFIGAAGEIEESWRSRASGRSMVKE